MWSCSLRGKEVRGSLFWGEGGVGRHIDTLDDKSLVDKNRTLHIPVIDNINFVLHIVQMIMLHNS